MNMVQEMNEGIIPAIRFDSWDLSTLLLCGHFSQWCDYVVNSGVHTGVKSSFNSGFKSGVKSGVYSGFKSGVKSGSNSGVNSGVMYNATPWK